MEKRAKKYVAAAATSPLLLESVDEWMGDNAMGTLLQYRFIDDGVLRGLRAGNQSIIAIVHKMCKNERFLNALMDSKELTAELSDLVGKQFQTETIDEKLVILLMQIMHYISVGMKKLHVRKDYLAAALTRTLDVLWKHFASDIISNESVSSKELCPLREGTLLLAIFNSQTAITSKLVVDDVCQLISKLLKASLNQDNITPSVLLYFGIHILLPMLPHLDGISKYQEVVLSCLRFMEMTSQSDSSMMMLLRPIQWPTKHPLSSSLHGKTFLELFAAFMPLVKLDQVLWLQDAVQLRSIWQLFKVPYLPETTWSALVPFFEWYLPLPGILECVKKLGDCELFLAIVDRFSSCDVTAQSTTVLPIARISMILGISNCLQNIPITTKHTSALFSSALAKLIEASTDDNSILAIFLVINECLKIDRNATLTKLLSTAVSSNLKSPMSLILLFQTCQEHCYVCKCDREDRKMLTSMQCKDLVDLALTLFQQIKMQLEWKVAVEYSRFLLHLIKHPSTSLTATQVSPISDVCHHLLIAFEGSLIDIMHSCQLSDSLYRILMELPDNMQPMKETERDSVQRLIANLPQIVWTIPATGLIARLTFLNQICPRYAPLLIAPLLHVCLQSIQMALIVFATDLPTKTLTFSSSANIVDLNLLEDIRSSLYNKTLELPSVPTTPLQYYWEPQANILSIDSRILSTGEELVPFIQLSKLLFNLLEQLCTISQSKNPSTLGEDRIHFKHILRHLCAMPQLALNDFQYLLHLSTLLWRVSSCSGLLNCDEINNLSDGKIWRVCGRQLRVYTGVLLHIQRCYKADKDGLLTMLYWQICCGLLPCVKCLGLLKEWHVKTKQDYKSVMQTLVQCLSCCLELNDSKVQVICTLLLNLLTSIMNKFIIQTKWVVRSQVPHFLDLLQRLQTTEEGSSCVHDILSLLSFSAIPSQSEIHDAFAHFCQRRRDLPMESIEMELDTAYMNYLPTAELSYLLYFATIELVEIDVFITQSMDELLALQAELAAAQRADGNGLKLSEHHVVDLMMKMQKLGKINLIYTLDAKAVLTPKQLNREIHDMLLRHMGRVTLSDLYQGINVDISLIENECKAIALGSSDIRFISGELIAEWYLDGIMEDMNEALQATGHVTMGDLALQYGFTVEFMATVVESRLGSIVKAQIKSNSLYTEAFVARQGARIRGIFSAITMPIALPEIVSMAGIDEQTIVTTVAYLIECKSLNGTLRGREYVPQIFLDTQRRLIFDFYASNGYLPFAMAHQLHIQRPFDYLKKECSDAIALRNIAVSHQLFVQVESAIDEAIQEQSWVDGRSLFPASIADNDISELLSKCSALKSTKKIKSAIQIDQVYVASSGFLNSVLEKFHENAAEKADKAALDVIQLKTQHKDHKNPRKKKAHTVQDALSIVPSKVDMGQLILQWFECCQDEDEFVAGLVQEIHKRVADIYESTLDKAIHAIHRGGSTTKHELEALFESRFDSLHVKLVCLQKGLQKLHNVDKEDADMIHQHIMATTALTLCNLVLSFVKDVFEVPLNDVASLNEAPILLRDLSSTHITLLEKHTSIAPEIIQLWSIRDLSELINYLSTLANALSMPLQKCDRKKERAVQSALKAQLDQRVHEANADLPALILCAMLLKATNLTIEATAKDMVVPAMLNVLRPHVPEHVLAFVHESIQKDQLSDEDKQKLVALADGKQFC